MYIFKILSPSTLIIYINVYIFKKHGMIIRASIKYRHKTALHGDV